MSSRKKINYRQNETDFDNNFGRSPIEGIEIARGEPLVNLQVDGNFFALQENKVDINGSTVMDAPLKTPGITSTSDANGLIIRKQDGESVIARLGKDSTDTELTGKLVLGEFDSGVGHIVVNGVNGSASTLNIHSENIPSGNKVINIGTTYQGGETIINIGSIPSLTHVIIEGRLTVLGASAFTGESSFTSTTTSIIEQPVSILGGTTNAIETSYQRDRGIEFRWGGAEIESYISEYDGDGSETVTAHFDINSGEPDPEIKAGDSITINFGGVNNPTLEVIEGTWIIKTVNINNGSGTFTFDLITFDSGGEPELGSLIGGTYENDLPNSVIKSKIGFFGLDSDTKDFIFIPQSNQTEKFNYRGGYGRLRTNGLTLSDTALPSNNKLVYIDYKDNDSGSDRTYTIPDVGEDADFVMTEGDQTIDGKKTFSDNIVLKGIVEVGADADAANIRATAGSGTDASGGNLILSSGNSTGTAISKIVFETPTPGVTSGNTLNSPAPRLEITNASITDKTGILVGDKNTQNIYNTTATTVNFAGAATTLTIGATTGTATIRNAEVVLSGDLQVQGGDITTDQPTFNLINTIANTVNFAGAATTGNFGYAGTTASTTNISTGAITTGLTKTINIGTGGVADSTTNIVLGSAAPNALGTVTVNSNLTCTKTISALDFNSTSDAQLKENVHTIEDALSLVSQLRGVRFDWKESKKESIGMIAQEIEHYVPEVVSTNSETGYKSVSYGNLVGLLIEAVKELKSEIDQLKSNKA